ncbi:hypothetical protein MCUN1_002757 [Malassezia cuniculi]|uniref:NADH-ubiquinone oxidoreductase B15 subunit n=1 Tax=Malassezia cuniculi TaxID=948313 RepID=A0AAF0EVG6_9BASI|nr:hypothetical protein MCUN1_002757 [Malassezia cuniculi]
MAGGHIRSVKIDPAVERWQDMHNSMYTRFRWTSKNTFPILFLVFAVPTAAFYGFSATNYRWDLRGKTKEESLLHKPAQE